LYYCFPPSVANPRPICIGAVRLDHLDVGTKVKTVKKQRWAILELKGQDKKQQFYSPRGPNGEPIKYPRSKSRASHLYLRHSDEAAVQEWRGVIQEQCRLPSSVEPSDEGDLLSEASETSGANDQTALDMSDEEDGFLEDDNPMSDSTGETSIPSSSSTPQGSVQQLKGYLEIRDLQVWNKRFFKIDGTHGRVVLAFFRSDKSLGEEDILGVVRLEKNMAVVPVTLEEDGGSARDKRKERGDRFFSFKLYHTEQRRIFSLTKRDGTKLPSTRDHGNAFELFLRTTSPQERNDWIQSISDVIKSAPARFIETVPLVAPDTPYAPTHFLNLLMARNWEDMVASEVLKKNIQTMIEKEIALIQLPKFITHLAIKELHVGSRFFDFLSYRYRTIVHPDIACPEIIADLMVRYQGGLSIELILEIHSKVITIPIRVRVQLQELSGRVSIYAPPSTSENPSPKWQLFFPEPPSFAWDVTLKAEKLKLSKLSKVKNFLISALEAQVCSAIVWPSRLTFHIPFPGRKLGIKLEKITTQLRPVRDGSRRQAPFPYETETVITLKFIVGRFMDELLNNWDQEVIPQIFSHDTKIFGLNPFYDGAYEGFQGIKGAVAELRHSFPDLRATILDMSVEGSSNVIVRFNLRGTHTNDFWESPATNKRILLHGLFTARIGQTLINILRFYWDPASIYALL
ncbi:MAG: ester cyclase, partial [archaeon]|nr:ester cyclase [archaeon]